MTESENSRSASEGHQCTRLRKILSELHVKERYAALLKDERKAAGLTVDELATQLSLNPVDLRAWESGKISPPASSYCAILTHLGPSALENATQLDFMIQVEFNERLMRLRSQSPNAKDE